MPSSWKASKLSSCAKHQDTSTEFDDWVTVLGAFSSAESGVDVGTGKLHEAIWSSNMNRKSVTAASASGHAAWGCLAGCSSEDVGSSH